MSCKAEIKQGPNKGKTCGRKTDTEYCSKHLRQTLDPTIKYCDVSRGCYTVLEEHQTKCTHCLHKARINDRKRNDKKRQDKNLCLDCGNNLAENRAIGKNKPLHRCVPCYEKLKETEIKRPKRERNYKSEALKNKYVAWNHYVKGAKKRNIDFTLSKIKFNELIVEKCYYCDYKVDNEINGIDRIDNNKGYAEENVVTCCQFCNVAKGTQHPQEFIDKMKAIHQFITNGIKIEQSVIDKWKTTYLSKKPVYTTYKKSANTRNYDFTITEEEFNAIIAKSCYLCGIHSNNGIDRFKNNIGYVLENCKPCCGHCNLLKKDLNYEHIIEIAKGIDRNYDNLTRFFSTIEVTVRKSKVEARIKVENPITAESENREYKPLDEIVTPTEFPEMKFIKPKKQVKQWKVAQIQKAILENRENEYKEFCEQNNGEIPNWDIKWATFVLSVKDSLEQEKIIRDFIEDLRRIRHNELCYKNAKIDRADREQWPSTTVLRAYEEGKINQFKEFQEKYTGDTPEDAFWKKKWEKFMEDLKGDNKLDIIKKFMTAQRTRVYRAKKK